MPISIGLGLDLVAGGAAFLDRFVTLPVHLRTADKNQLDITGDLEIVARIAATDWSTGADQVLVAKEQTGTTRSFRWAIGATGIPYLGVSTDGSALSTGVATTNPNFVDGTTAYWHKVTRRQSDGRTQFWQAADQTVEPTPGAWSQIGANVTLASGSAIFSSTSQLEIGSRFAATQSTLAGRVSRVIVRSGVDGTVAADFDANQLGAASSYADAYGNTWAVG